MRVLFLGFALPEDRFSEFLERESGMPTQTQRFGRAVVASLRSGGATVDVVSAAPASDFPHHRRVMFRPRRLEEEGHLTREMGFLNLTGLKHLTRYLSARAAMRGRGPARPDAVLVHGVNSALLWAALRAGRRWRVPVVVLLTDAPSLPTRFDTRLSLAMKGADRRLILSALGRVSGVVALAPRLAADFAPGIPALPMEGIASWAGSEPERPPASPPRVVYAGGLHEAYGVKELLHSVSDSTSDWQLHLYGRGPLEVEARRMAEHEPRIVIHGLVAHDELTHAYADASVLVNPRPPGGPLAEYSFPSKLLEYLCTGRPVMTTRLPTLPDDLVDHVLLTTDDARGLARAIDRFLARPEGDRLAVGIRARSFTVASRGPEAQGRRLVSFLSSIS